MTNGDRIRKISDDDLAEILQVYHCEDCIAEDFCELNEPSRIGCRDTLVYWMKSEANDE